MGMPHEDAMFDLALFVLTSARTTVGEPKRYGPRRLLDSLEKVLNLPLIDRRIPIDPFLETIREQIAQHPEFRTSSVVFTHEFTAFLDGMIFQFVDEMKKRSRGTHEKTGRDKRLDQ